VTKTQSAGPISCLEHHTTRVLHCAIVTRAAVSMFPLLLQSIVRNQMRPQRLRGAWFSRFLRHPARRWSGSVLIPRTNTGAVKTGIICIRFCSPPALLQNCTRQQHVFFRDDALKIAFRPLSLRGITTDLLYVQKYLS